MGTSPGVGSPRHSSRVRGAGGFSMQSLKGGGIMRAGGLGG